MKTSYDLMMEMSKSDHNELESRLSTVVQHMLKLDNLPHLLSYNSRIWQNTIGRERGVILDLLDNRKPGLKPQLTQELVNKAYKVARAKVSAEFPRPGYHATCPYSLEEVVGSDVFSLLKNFQ